MSDFDLCVHHLRFALETETPIRLGPQAGAQLRGALWSTLQQFACTDATARNDPVHTQNCPMCHLVALENGKSVRGRNPPRPFAIRPPLAQQVEQDRQFEPGDMFTVGLNLFGDAAALFPYVCQAFYRMGEIGVGYGRGQFTLERVQAINPLSGESQDLLMDRRVVAGPDLPVTSEQIDQVAATFPSDSLRLRFLTPAQITHSKGRLATEPHFDKLIARLLERCQLLELHYTDSPTPQPVWKERYLSLTEAAKEVRLARCNTRWVRIQSGSRRTNNRNALGGIVGEATYEGDLSPFGKWLLWGQSLHVGKNTVKGNGWYEILDLH